MNVQPAKNRQLKNNIRKKSLSSRVLIAFVIFSIASFLTFRYFQDRSEVPLDDQASTIFNADDIFHDIRRDLAGQEITVQAKTAGCVIGPCRVGQLETDLSSEQTKFLFGGVPGGRNFQNLVVRGTLEVRDCWTGPMSFCRKEGEPSLKDPEIISAEFLCDAHDGRAFVEEATSGPMWACELPDGTTVPEYRLK